MNGGRLWVGIDAGTQGVRVVVVSDAGRVHGRGAAALTGHRDAGRHEQDPAQWWDALAAAARQAVSGVDTVAIRGLAVAATSGTVLLTDQEGGAVTTGLMYDDVRAGHEAEAATAAGADLWRTLGYQRVQPAWGLPKLRWLLDRYPAVVPGARLAHQSDFLAGRLAGQPVPADLGNALKSGCDLRDGSWPAGVMATLGVPAHVLSPLVPSGTPVGSVGPAAAAATGIPAGVPILAGTTDGCAAQLGAGVVEVGDWNCALGTTLVLKGVAEDLVTDPSGAVYSHRAPDGRWLPGGASSCGAGAIARTLPGRDLAALAARADGSRPEPVLTYPLAAGRGERFPFVAPAAEPFQVGEPPDDVAAYAALVQGIGFVERLCFDHLAQLGAPVHGRRVLTGGAAASPYACQVRADIMGWPVAVSAPADAGLGAAVLAAASERGLPAAARDMVSVSARYQPRPAVAGRFTGHYLRFVDELSTRQWLPQPLAEQAYRRAGM